MSQFNIIVGNKIRRERENVKLSQTELARRMKQQGYAWHQVTVARTESGERPLRLDEGIAISGILEISVENLYGRQSRESSRTAFLELATSINVLEANLQEAIGSHSRLCDEIDHLDTVAINARAAMEEAQFSFEQAIASAGAARTKLRVEEQRISDIREQLDRLRADMQRFDRSVDPSSLLDGIHPGDLVDITIKKISEARVMISPEGPRFELFTQAGQSLLKSAPFGSEDEASRALRRFLRMFVVSDDSSSSK